MMKGRRFLCTLLACVTLLCVQAAQEGRKIVAYVTSWTSITPDPFVMTHINYAFGGVGSDGVSVYADNTSRLRKIVKLKEQNPQLKVLLSLGGWGRGGFTPMAQDADKRKKFAQACRTFCQTYNLDGIDIDWEFPGNNSSGETSPSNEKANYTLLMRDLREALADDYLLTMASSSDPGYYDFRACIQYLDFVNVMTYDMSGPPNHHAALYRGGKVGNGWLVASESIKKHLSAGIPRTKLVMGIPFYGNSGAGSQISLQEIKDGIKSGKWTDHWDDVAKVPYVTNASGSFAYGYDDERSLKHKCQYIDDQALAGAMYWEYANDDNAGTERNTLYDLLIGNAVDHTPLQFGNITLPYAGGNRYSAVAHMQQGALYTLEALLPNDWYYDPDFFAPHDDAFRFLPISGTYSLTVDLNYHCFRVVPLDEAGNPLTFSRTTGTGCVWLIGANASYGKPSYVADSGEAWDTDHALPLAPVGEKLHRITFEVGRQLNPDMVNFKFFFQNGWGGEFNSSGQPRITTSSRIFYVDTSDSANGNIKLRAGKKLQAGTIYQFTLDTSNLSKAVLTIDDVTDQYSAVDAIVNDAALRSPRLFDLQGRPLSRPQRGIVIQGMKKVVWF